MSSLLLFFTFLIPPPSLSSPSSSSPSSSSSRWTSPMSPPRPLPLLQHVSTQLYYTGGKKWTKVASSTLAFTQHGAGTSPNQRAAATSWRIGGETPSEAAQPLLCVSSTNQSNPLEQVLSLLSSSFENIFASVSLINSADFLSNFFLLWGPGGRYLVLNPENVAIFSRGIKTLEWVDLMDTCLQTNHLEALLPSVLEPVSSVHTLDIRWSLLQEPIEPLF